MNELNETSKCCYESNHMSPFLLTTLLFIVGVSAAPTWDTIILTPAPGSWLLNMTLDCFATPCDIRVLQIGDHHTQTWSLNHTGSIVHPVLMTTETLVSQARGGHAITELIRPPVVMESVQPLAEINQRAAVMTLIASVIMIIVLIWTLLGGQEPPSEY